MGGMLFHPVYETLKSLVAAAEDMELREQVLLADVQPATTD